jgi:hypothetical protein
MDILKLSQYEARNHSETANSKGFVNYGTDNMFPQYLVDLYYSSATHNALTTTIGMMIFGEGFDASTLDGRVAFDQWNLNDELRKACLDFKIQGGFALEVNWSLDRTTIANVSHLPYENVRSGFVNDDENVDFYYYSKDWSSRRIDPEEICTFDPERNIDYPTQILYVKPFSPGSFYYPKPDYIGSINYIELDKEIGVYHINNMMNGMSPSFSIHFKNGIPPQEERTRIRMDIEKQLSGASNAGKFIVTYSDDPERKPDFEPFQLSDAHNQYQFLSEEVTSKIMVGHRVTNPQMFGVAVPGKLGGGGELAESAELFEQNVILPSRQIVTEAIQTLLRASGLDAQVIQLSEQQEEEVNLGAAADWLLKRGEDMSEEWDFVDEYEVDYQIEDEVQNRFEFATKIPGDANRKSKIDNDVVRIRYRYQGSIGDDSREFCRKMMSGGAKLYRKEDIEAAGQIAVNPGFGPGGSNTYSCWLYKGGPNCGHRWLRQVYLRKNNEKITVAKARRIINELPFDERAKNKIESEDPLVSIRPENMPNHGYLNPR